jgi:drug/metabolite transporter (DMT)-like permease
VNGNLILVLLTGLGWGLLGPAGKALFAQSPAFDGMTLAVARAVWAFPFFLIMLALTWRADPPKMKKRSWCAALGAGVVFGFFVSVLYTVATQHTSIAHISFIVGISPVTNTVLAALALRLGLDRRTLAALALGIVGIALLAFTQKEGAANLAGDLLMLGWLLAFGAYAILLRVIGPGVSSRFVMALVGTVSMGVVLVPGIALGYGGAIAHVADTPAAGWWFFGEVVFGSTLIAQTSYAAAVRRMGVSMATIGAEYTALAVGIGCSLALRETWTPLTVIACAVFCAALAVTFVPIPGLAGPLRSPSGDTA